MSDQDKQLISWDVKQFRDLHLKISDRVILFVHFNYLRGQLVETLEIVCLSLHMLDHSHKLGVGVKHFEVFLILLCINSHVHVGQEI